MRKLKFCMLLAVVAIVAAPALAASDVHVFLGQKSYSEDGLDDLDLDKAFEYGVGVNLDFEWPVMLTVDVMRADDDSSYTYVGRGITGYTYTYDLETTELHVGVRYPFLKDSNIQPYVGGGAAYVMTDLKLSSDFDSFSDDDSDVGYYGNVGVLFNIGETFAIGVDVRYSDADAELSSGSARGGSSTIKADAGGLHYGVTAGWRW